MRVAEIKITLRSAAIAPKITARELVSRARVYRTSARVHAPRAKTARKERERRKSRRERASERERGEKKRKRKARPAERSFASRVRSWRANGVIAFRDYDVEIRCSLPYPPSRLVARARTKREGGPTERKITGSREIFRAVKKQGNYSRWKDPRAQFNAINRGEMKHRVVIFPRIIIFAGRETRTDTIALRNALRT